LFLFLGIVCLSPPRKVKLLFLEGPNSGRESLSPGPCFFFFQRENVFLFFRGESFPFRTTCPAGEEPLSGREDVFFSFSRVALQEGFFFNLDAVPLFQHFVSSPPSTWGPPPRGQEMRQSNTFLFCRLFIWTTPLAPERLLLFAKGRPLSPIRPFLQLELYPPLAAKRENWSSRTLFFPPP